MTFILSPEIIDDIIFAMENQTEILLFDALEGICVDMDEIDDDYGTVIDDQRYYGYITLCCGRHCSMRSDSGKASFAGIKKY